MVWLLFFWGVGGPHVHAVLHSEATCEALREREEARQPAAIVLCVPMQLDNLVSDVVLYDPETKQQIRRLK